MRSFWVIVRQLGLCLSMVMGWTESSYDFARTEKYATSAGKNHLGVIPIAANACWSGALLWGLLIYEVSRLGFKSVAHYLIQTRRGQIHPEDSGLANLDPEGRDLAPADKGLQLLANNESLSADKHQDRYPDLHTNRDKLRWKKRKNKCNALTLLMDMVIISNADDELKREKIYGYAAILLTRCIWQVTLVFMAALLGVSVNCFWYIE